MEEKIQNSLLLIAGRFEYPLLLAKAAREHGVKHIEVIAFKGETYRKITSMADKVHWLNLGQMKTFVATVEQIGIKQAILAGQLAPSNLFTLRMDRMAKQLYESLNVHTAHTIFGAVVEEIEKVGVSVLPGDTFMDAYTPRVGVMSQRPPTAREETDIALGLQVVKETSDLEIGQTVVIKEGVIVAVEALEGTNKAIRRGGRVGRAGCVVIKVPKKEHDMRFDIPVVGTKTFQVMRRARVSCLAVEANRTILLQKERLIELANQFGMSFVAISVDQEGDA